MSASHEEDGGSDWHARALVAASQPPLRPREPLHLDVAGQTVLVGSIERDLAQRMVASGLPLAPAAEGWLVEAPAVPSLATIAGWLRDAGLAGQWRDELLSVVDSDERAVAEVERGVVRALGLTTYAVHLVGHSFDGQGIWVQQRAFDKATDPGRWDTLMGGQVSAGETVDTALTRETWEEAGLDTDALLDLRRGERITFRLPVVEGYMVEHIDIFTARLPHGIEPRNLDGEVQRFECLGGAELEQWLARGEFTLEASLVLAAALKPG